MSSRKAPYCSDVELLNELKKLGYNDVTPDVFQMMKEDLSELVEEEQYPSEVSKKERRLSSSTIIKYSTTHHKHDEMNGKYTGKLMSQTSQEKQINEDSKISEGSSLSNGLVKDDPYSKYRNRFNSFKLNTYAKQQADKKSLENTEVDSPNIDSEPSSSVSAARNYTRIQNKYDLSAKLPEIVKSRELNSDQKFTNSSSLSSLSETDDPLSNYRRRFKLNTFARRQDTDVLEENKECNRPFESSLSSSSVSIAGNKIKRKVLRHKDGKPVITEEFLDIPSIFNTSYPETENLESSKSFSSDDLSWKSNGSTGSINALSPVTHSASQSSYSTPRSLHFRIANQRKKKNDPVAMYNYYKKFWNNFKPPGEKTHDKLRWAVRDKMLDYNL